MRIHALQLAFLFEAVQNVFTFQVELVGNAATCRDRNGETYDRVRFSSVHDLEDCKSYCRYIAAESKSPSPVGLEFDALDGICFCLFSDGDLPNVPRASSAFKDIVTENRGAGPVESSSASHLKTDCYRNKNFKITCPAQVTFIFDRTLSSAGPKTVALAETLTKEIVTKVDLPVLFVLDGSSNTNLRPSIESVELKETFEQFDKGLIHDLSLGELFTKATEELGHESVKTFFIVFTNIEKDKRSEDSLEELLEMKNNMVTNLIDTNRIPPIIYCVQFGIEAMDEVFNAVCDVITSTSLNGISQNASLSHFAENLVSDICKN